MFIPGSIDAVGAGDLGAVVMPGIGAIVGDGEAFAGTGDGGLFFTGAGAGVAIGIPGMGAIVGCAATAGEAVRTIENAVTAKRERNKGTSGKACILRAVVRLPQTLLPHLRFPPALETQRERLAVMRQQIGQVVAKRRVAER